jgi:SAM-dependent methyltransferase
LDLSMKSYRNFLAKINNAGVRKFYRYEAALAVEPIYLFLQREGRKLVGLLLDIGCGSKPYRECFTESVHYYGIDFRGNQADIWADINLLPVTAGKADIVLCNQVLEHVAYPERVIAEIARALKPSGCLILSIPQMGRLHGEPEDYFRFTKWGIQRILKDHDFDIMLLEEHGGFFRALGSHTAFFICEKFGRHQALWRNLVIAPLIGLSRWMDRRFYWTQDTLGYNVLAIKRINNG